MTPKIPPVTDTIGLSFYFLKIFTYIKASLALYAPTLCV